MSCMEASASMAPGAPHPTDSDSTCDRRKETDTLDSQNMDPKSTSVKTIDDASDDNAFGHDSTPKSHDVSSELVSPKQDKVADQDTIRSNSNAKEEDLSTWLKKQLKKVNVKWSDYEAFRNRFSLDEGHDIIEVLQGHPDQLRMEISHERAKRQHKTHSASRTKHQAENDAKFMHRIRIQSPVILHVLARLMGQHPWTGPWSTFFRPFQSLYYSFPYAKQVLKILERRMQEGQSQDGDMLILTDPLQRLEETLSIETEDPLQKLSMPSDVDIEDVVYGLLDNKPGSETHLTAVEHMKLYIDFVEKYVVPMWVEARGSSKHKVRFSDLPMYFRPGDILYEPLKSGDDKNNPGKSGFDATRSRRLDVHQNYWKLCYTQFQVPPSRKGDEENDRHNPFYRMSNYDFGVFSFHIDFDGDNYGPMPGDIFFHNFEGEVDIRSLNMYPLRFNADATQTFTELTNRAKNFMSYIRERHLTYDGWTLVHETYSRSLSNNQKRTGVEHIEGEVMVDFKEGFQSDSGFVKPDFDIPADPEESCPACIDTLLRPLEQLDLRTQWWSDTARSKRKGFCPDFYIVQEPFCALQNSRMLKEDKVLKSFDEGQMVFDFDPEHLFLFPQRLIAYSFRARKFFVANIDFISVIKAPKNPFRDLKIEIEHKRILKSLVGLHFEKQDIRRQNKDAILDQDFIQGKGSGLLILLHGVPGVGKTTTAEAVALDHRKPLFALTSGDLGSTPKEVESALRETFRLAAMWDCVLLLDEADLFLAKRDVGDLVRNSLVSDYYDGVLFLTTNRVGILDEAFRSRIHLSLYFPALRKKQALEIFKLNIQRVKDIEKFKADIRGKADDSQSKLPPVEIDEDSIINFAKRHWENARNDPSRRWNGRQIRNSFQVAYSLVNLVQISVPESHYDDDYDDEDVDYDDEPDFDITPPKFRDHGVSVAPPTSSIQEKKPGKLDSSQFEIVARSIQRFDSYLYKTRGLDSDYAKTKNLRRDDYVDSDDEYRSPRGPSQYADARFPRLPHRGTHSRSTAPPGHLAPPSDHGGRMHRTPPGDREQNPYSETRAPVSDDVDDEYFEQGPRLRAGPPPGSYPRRRQRNYDDEYEYTHHRYR